MRDERIQAIRRTLSDPHRVVARLGLGEGAKRQHQGLLVRCPSHSERTPSCSVTRGPDGSLRVKCFGCDLAGDVLTLVAAANRLSIRRDFATVLDAASELAGLPRGKDACFTRFTGSPIDFPESDVSEAVREYPTPQDVKALWESALPTGQVECADMMLYLRGLAPDADLARALPDGAVLPDWARFRGETWVETGHRVIVPAYDHEGTRRSVRAWATTPGYEGPKRLPPAGHKATGLVLANQWALEMLHASAAPCRLLIGEGEGDYLALCQAYPCTAVIGVVNGSWSDAFAERVPFGSEVMVRTHRDEAGERYAQAILKSVKGRAVVKRVA